MLNFLVNPISLQEKFEKSQKAYKLFRVDPSQPGKVFPLFVGADKPVPFGVWIEAELLKPQDGGKIKSKLGPLAFRPGWHSGDVPVATHIGDKSQDPETGEWSTKPTHRNKNYVWAEVEVANDVDWQSVANSRATRNKNGELVARTAHITDQLPVGGFYRYKTNPNMTGEWLISGEIKVIRVLTDDEVIALNNERGVHDLPRIAPLDLGLYGFGDDGLPL